ncbi:conjugal transfer mating pair stabilization protein TraN [Modicisalibacter sp. MOD 31.J]|uniref:conjugal transfer mating pair stabilization protein TraN n=1 Tax=Modicisalibacter sp. MOD 31.J TaxID=2831897 RepID=UPI001EBCD29A|nr:conjugal transfer mating pair stabilization protein TraN [Modicisalibacter sp. MOD 31.J]MBZ9574510.1 conjugal transfer mating pair stabilization protein TraN [Modicisalibacter sp. MOD 31.J]
MAITPTTQVLADSFSNAANQGESFGRGIVPNPNDLFRSDEGNGGYKIFPGSDDATTISTNELFGAESDSASGLKGLSGDDEAIREKTISTQNRLSSAPSEYGEAYRVLSSSSQRAHTDMSKDPIWDSSRDVMEDIFGNNGDFSACEVSRKVTEDSFTTHLPDYRTCNRVPAVGESCSVNHDYIAGVIFHESGPLNVQSCGSGCRTVWLGRVGDNYWGGRCSIYEHQMSFRVLQPKAITSAVINYAKWDDYMQIWVDGKKVWAGPNNNFPPETGGSCELETSWEQNPNTDITSILRSVEPGDEIRVKVRVSVTGGGEGYARLRIKFDASQKVANDEWNVSDGCQTTMEAIESGFASGNYTCTDMPSTSNGCISLGVTKICESDLKSSPMPGISPLCRQVKVEADLDFNKGNMSCWTDPQGQRRCPQNAANVPDTCKALESDPNCRFIESQCIDGAKDANGNCYAYNVRYDCGKDVDIPTANAESTYSCPGGVRCMGSECVTTTQESNDDFARAVGALQAADHMAMDMSCPSDQEQNIDVNTCEVFQGEAAECKKAVGGVVDCCEKPSSGVSLGQYIQLLQTTRKVSGLVVGEGGALHGAWTELTGPVTDAWNSITSYFSSSLDANSASTPLRMVGMEQLKQEVMKQTAQVMVDTFGADAASMFFTNQAGGGLATNAGGQLAGGSVQLSAAVGTALSVVMWAYTIYTVAMILIKIIWECEEDELQLGVKRKLKSAHYVGSYCASEVLGACVEEREAYCTFNSPLSRIIQEQARKQLGIGWGDAEDPNCRGLTVAEINKLDWDKINLDEWLAILQTTGNLPSASEAMNAFSMDELTQNTPTLNTDGEREDTLTRNKQRLDNEWTLDRNEDRRQKLWNGDPGQGNTANPPPEPAPRPSPCVSGYRLFKYTGNVQHFTVPPECRRLHVVVEGGDSGAADNLPGNEGQHVTKKLVVDPGDTLPIRVGRGGGVDSYWDEARGIPAYVGLAGQMSALYKPNGEVWARANGGEKVGPVSSRGSKYWRGQNGWVLIGWGEDPGSVDGLPTPTPVPAPEDPEPACEPGRRVFGYTGSLQSFTVPEGCGHLDVVVDGAGGGGAGGAGLSSNGGPGARVSGTIAVKPQTNFLVLVGQGGGVATHYTSGPVTAGGGGGRSAILESSGAPMVVAGGGGGAYRGDGAPGGGNGGDIPNVDAVLFYGAITGPQGGTQNRGGAGGIAYNVDGSVLGRGLAGRRGVGGGSTTKCDCNPRDSSGSAYGGGGPARGVGGGGGGGYYGGGGGANGPGAGGSSYTSRLSHADVSTGGGGQGGTGPNRGDHGRLVIEWRR